MMVLTRRNSSLKPLPYKFYLFLGNDNEYWRQSFSELFFMAIVVFIFRDARRLLLSPRLIHSRQNLLACLPQMLSAIPINALGFFCPARQTVDEGCKFVCWHMLFIGPAFKHFKAKLISPFSRKLACWTGVFRVRVPALFWRTDYSTLVLKQRSA